MVAVGLRISHTNCRVASISAFRRGELTEVMSCNCSGVAFAMRLSRSPMEAMYMSVPLGLLMVVFSFIKIQR